MSGSGGWELSKENIQPLSSGRRFRVLTESLPADGSSGIVDQQQYEAFHLEEVCKLQQYAETQGDNDPLQGWLSLATYMEQHFPNMNTKVKGMYLDILRKVSEKYFLDERYQNDKRYAELVLKTLEHSACSPLQQAALIQNFLNNNRCEKISTFYIRLAEIYIGEGDDKRALEILRKGIAENAQPKSSLEELLTFIQNNWAAKNLQAWVEDGASGSRPMRSFASSVPIVGETNEAVTIRRDLQPAAPATARPVQYLPSDKMTRNLPIYTEPEEHATKENREAPRIETITSRADQDRENRMEAARWNTSCSKLTNPASFEPIPEKFQLYVEPLDQSTVVKLNSVSDRVLRERKESETEGTTPIPTIAETDPADVLLIKKESSVIDAVKQPTKRKTKDFFEDIRYKSLPSGRSANRTMLKAKAWLSEYEQRKKQKEEKECKLASLQVQIERLSKENRILEEKLGEHQRISELKLSQKEEKIMELESQNEDIVNQLTKLTTSNNAKDHQHLREKRILEQELYTLKQQLDENQQFIKVLMNYKEKYEALLEEKISREGEQQLLNRSGFNQVLTDKQPVSVDVFQRPNTYSYSSPSAEENSPDISRFNSGETTIAGNSFCPNLKGEKSEICIEPLRASRTYQSEMLDLTPAIPPTEGFTLPPASLREFSCFKKPPTRTFSLYESLSDSFANPSLGKGDPQPVNKRTDFMKSIQTLSENVPPPQTIASSSNENPGPDQLPPMWEGTAGFTEGGDHAQNQFRKPGVPIHKPSTTNYSSAVAASVTTEPGPSFKAQLPGRGRQSLSSRAFSGGDGDGDDEWDDVILRRHQQTGVDLNISNLTTLLALGPKPLTNSTPEKLREPPLSNAMQDADEFQGVSVSAKVARLNSILNDPPLNLSTIQETSRERSRNTTSSSSSNNMTASTTRFGMVSSTTQQFFVTARSSSVPRTSQVTQPNFNGYHSDTNGK